MSLDQSKAKLLDSWEQQAVALIVETQASLEHQRSLLEFQIDAYPFPFQPSPVLIQLIRNNQRQTSGTKQTTRNVEYLERKLETEIRQHYELENARHCGERKNLHLQNSDSLHSLRDRLKQSHQKLCCDLNIGLHPELTTGKKPSNNYLACIESRTSPEQTEMDAEEWLLSDLQQNWVAQERFNIQEAFTNQTRKLQTDLDEFLEQLDDEFITKRQRVLAEGMFKSSSKYSATVLHIKKARQHCAEGYKSDAQRKLLLQSAGNSSVSWTEPLVTSSIAKDCARSKNRHDVSQTNQKLDELQHRLQQLKEDAEASRKARMAQIGRQCAHMFTQLDCKETEAKLAFLLHDQEAREFGAIRKWVSKTTDSTRQLL